MINRHPASGIASPIAVEENIGHLYITHRNYHSTAVPGRYISTKYRICQVQAAALSLIFIHSPAICVIRIAKRAIPDKSGLVDGHGIVTPLDVKSSADNCLIPDEIHIGEDGTPGREYAPTPIIVLSLIKTTWESTRLPSL